MRRLIAVTVLGLLVTGSLVATSRAADDTDKKPKFNTKQVMKECFKGPLIKKVTAGEASEKEIKTLHEMLVAMSMNKPPMGEAASWKKLCDSLVQAGKACVEGDAEGAAMLKKAANCKACHSVHKPPAE